MCKTSLRKVSCLLLLHVLWLLPQCVESQVKGNHRSMETVTLSSSKDLKYLGPSIPFGMYPSYVQDPEQFRRVTLGIGSFQGRHLLEDEMRKSAQRNMGTTNAYRMHGLSSGGYFGQFAPKH